jgi:hypothetical protein
VAAVLIAYNPELKKKTVLSSYQSRSRVKSVMYVDVDDDDDEGDLDNFLIFSKACGKCH